MGDEREIPTDVWKQNFGSKPDPTKTKAMKAVGGFDFEEMDHDSFDQGLAKQKYEDELPGFRSLSTEMQIPEFKADLESLWVDFMPEVVCAEAFTSVCEFCESFDENFFQPYPKHHAIAGFVFENTRFAQYILRIERRHDDNLVLTLNRQDGFAPALMAMWSGMQEYLINENFVQGEDEESFTDVDFSDSEDDGFTLDFGAVNYLNIATDPTLVESWVEDLQDPNFMSDTLLLMAHNSNNERNLVCMTEQAQELFDRVIDAIKECMDFLPVVMSAMRFIENLSRQASVKVTEDTLDVMTDALKQWTCTEPSRFPNRVTKNEFLATRIAENLGRWHKCGDLNTQALQNVIDKTEFNQVSKLLAPLLAASQSGY